MKRTLETREDIGVLVRTFYNEVRRDSLIGPIFNSIIGNEENWEVHLEKLTDFWQTNLLNERAYKGSPMGTHQAVDKEIGNTIEQTHFDRWMKIWSSTLDHNFEGDKAERAKANAQNIATFMLLKIQMVR